VEPQGLRHGTGVLRGLDVVRDGGGMFQHIHKGFVSIALVCKGFGKNVGKLFDGLVLSIAKGGKRGGWMRMIQRLNQVLNGLCSNAGGL
jgi:hypothetical protein